MKNNLLQKFLPASVIILLLIGFISYVDYRSDKNLFESENLIQHSEEIINQSNKILLSGGYIESAAQSFVITNDSSYITLIPAHEKEMFKHIETMRQLTKDNSLQQSLTDSLIFYSKKRLGYIAEMIKLRRMQSEMPVVTASVYENLGKQYVGHIRRIIEKIQAQENTLLNRRREINMHSEKIYKFISYSMYVLMAMLAMVMLYVTCRYMMQSRERNKRAAELRSSNKKLIDNIDLRKKTEQEMKWLINNTEESFLLLDTNFNIVSFNHCAHKLYLKYLSGNLIKGNYFLENAKPARRQKTLKIYEKVLNGSVEKNDIIIKLADGSEKIFELIYKPAKNEQEDIIGIFISAVDLTEQRTAEIKLKESELRYRSLIEQATDAICIADASLRFIDANPYACEVLGYTKEEVTRLYINDIIFAEDLADNPFRFTELNPQEMIRNERRIKRKDGTAIVMEVSTRLMEDGRFIFFGHDVSERKAAENRLKELNEQIRQHSKELLTSNTELEQFAYVASHDLQEPLRMVTSFLALLEKRYAELIDEKGKKYISFAVDGAERMRQIIFDLLEFSRVSHIKDKLENVNLNRMIAEIKLQFEKDITEKGASVISQTLPVVTAYKTPLFRVFQNLISNALKYRQEGVLPKVYISYKESNTHWEFAVADNGIGIEAEYFEKIFVIFQRLHNRDEFSGTGIGLAITKKIVETHGGKIWLTSEEGKGSTFYFTLLKQE